MKIRKQAIDLTDLAIGIITLGILVSIGATILISMRDSRLSSQPVFTVTNESVTPTTAGVKFTNTWCTGVNRCINLTGVGQINSANYTVTVDKFGVCTIANATAEFNNAWQCNYTGYNTTNADWTLANSSAIGLAEYGNWFKIIVIVGVAAVVLGLIFLAFGRGGGSGSSGIGGEY